MFLIDSSPLPRVEPSPRTHLKKNQQPTVSFRACSSGLSCAKDRNIPCMVWSKAESEERQRKMHSLPAQGFLLMRETEAEKGVQTLHFRDVHLRSVFNYAELWPQGKNVKDLFEQECPEEGPLFFLPHCLLALGLLPL